MGLVKNHFFVGQGQDAGFAKPSAGSPPYHVEMDCGSFLPDNRINGSETGFHFIKFGKDLGDVQA